MRAIVPSGAALALLALPLLALGCATTRTNYGDRAGPRFAGDPAMPGAACGAHGDRVRVATLNAAYATRVDGMIALLHSDAELRRAEIVVLEEMDEAATRRVAEALGFHWVYYPATLHPVSHRNFGNALLACAPIEADEKLLLPHASWIRGTRRAAVMASVRIGRRSVRVVALHLSTPLEVGTSGQREQAAVVIEATRDAPYVIIAGDFNGVGFDPFDRAGFVGPTRGLGPTHLVFDLDHVLARGFVPLAWGRVATAGVSDHRAVWAELDFADEAPTK